MVLPALNLSTLNAGILIMMQQVRLMMFSLNTVDYSMSFLLLSTQNFFLLDKWWDHSEPFLLFEMAHEILVSAKGPLVFGFWVWDLGLWGLGLTIFLGVLYNNKDVDVVNDSLAIVSNILFMNLSLFR